MKPDTCIICHGELSSVLCARLMNPPSVLVGPTFLDCSITDSWSVLPTIKHTNKIRLYYHGLWTLFTL